MTVAPFREEIDRPKLVQDYFRASDFDGQPVPEREWIVPRLIPAGNPTLLAGDGGTGKSLLGAQLCAAAALGREWLGQPVKAGKTLYLSAEDDRDELHRRFAAIASAEQVGLGELHGITVRCLAGEDALLAVPDLRSGRLLETPLFDDIAKMIERLRPALVVLDSLADVFGGNENDRAHVRQFVGMLRGWAIRHGCAVVLLAHPSLSGLNTGSGFSGSTAWNNSVRSRLYFSREKKGTGGEADDPDVRILEVMKANYGAIGDTIRVRWQDGVFVPDGEKRMDFISRASAQNDADRIFLQLLEQFDTMGREVSDKPGHSYAPALFEKSPGAQGITGSGFRSAMERLFASGRIQVETVGPPSRQKRRLVKGETTNG